MNLAVQQQSCGEKVFNKNQLPLHVIVGSEMCKVAQLDINMTKAELGFRLIIFADSLSREAGLTVDKCKNIADLFIDREDVKNCTVGEVGFFLNKALDFGYGDLYGGFGYDVLIKWWKAFNEEQKEARRRVKNDRNAVIKEDVSPKSLEELQNMYFTLKEELGGNVLYFPYSKVGRLLSEKYPKEWKVYKKINEPIIQKRLALGLTGGVSVGTSVSVAILEMERSVENELFRSFGIKYLEDKK